MKLYEINYNDYLISNNKNLLSLDKIFEFLAKSYWGKNRTKETIKESIEHSECYGIYLSQEQVGFARVVTDYSTMYWLSDVFIDEKHRKIGLGKKLIETIVDIEELKNLNGILGTKDAHSLYEKYGFVKNPEIFMIRRIG